MSCFDARQIAALVMQAQSGDAATIVTFATHYPCFFAGLVEVLARNPDWTADERDAATRAVLDELVTQLIAQQQIGFPCRVTGLPVTLAVK